MQLTDIKPLMTPDAPKLAGKAALVGLSGFMTDVVKAAEKQGIIRIEQDPARPAVRWVKLASAAQSTPPPDISQKDQSSPAPAYASSSSAQPASAERESIARVIRPTKPEPTQSQEASRELEKLLRARNQGPFSDARPFFYEALEERLNDEAYVPIPLVKLLESAEVVALEKLYESNKEKLTIKRARTGGTEPTDIEAAARTMANKQPWADIRAFIRTLIWRTGVALDIHGSRIVGGAPTSVLRDVKEFQKGWKDILDAEVALEAMRLWCQEYGVDGLHERYVDALAGMLHHRTYGDVVERTYRILSLLIPDRVEYDAEFYKPL